MHVRGRDQLGGLGPTHPHQPALAAGLMVATPALRVGLDIGPRQHRVAQPGLGFPVHLDQHAAGVGIPHPGRRVRVPGKRGAARATARLVLGPIRAHRRVVGLLGLPGDDAVLDVHLPRTRPGAVDAVGGTDHLVVAPAVPVEHVALPAAASGDGPQVVGELTGGEESAAALEQLLDRPADMGCGAHGGGLLVGGRAHRFVGVQAQRRVPECDERGGHQQQQPDRVVVVCRVVGRAHHQRREVAAQSACGRDDSGDRAHRPRRGAAGHPGEHAAGADTEEERQRDERGRRPHVRRRLEHRDERHHRGARERRQHDVLRRDAVRQRAADRAGEHRGQRERRRCGRRRRPARTRRSS